MIKVEEMDMKEIVNEINKLASFKKTRELTKQELQYREELKKVYLKNVRENFKNQLLNTKVINQNGEDITPQKIKEARKSEK